MKRALSFSLAALAASFVAPAGGVSEADAQGSAHIGPYVRNRGTFPRQTCRQECSTVYVVCGSPLPGYDAPMCPETQCRTVCSPS